MSTISFRKRTPIAGKVRSPKPAPGKVLAGRRTDLLHAALGFLFLAIMLFPVYWMVNTSLQPNGTTLPATWFPIKLDFSGYAMALAGQGRNLTTSLIVSLGTVGVSLMIAAPAAYALSHFKVRGMNVVLFAILITQMIPGIIVANALYTAYSGLGLLNSIGGLILANASHGIPFAIIILRAFMGTVPASIMEAGRVDGAGHLRVFWSIVLPLSRNALITAGLFTFLFAWGDFLFALTLTTTDAVRPITLGLYQYVGEQVTDWSSVMATGVLASLPALILLVVAQKFVASGTTAGGIK